MARVTIGPANLRDASFITANLRERDRIEARAQVGEIDNITMAAALLQSSAYAFVAYVRDVPALVFGAAPCAAVGLSMWAVGTNKAERAVPAATRFITGPLQRQAIADGWKWAEAHAIAGHERAHRWLEGMGAERIAELPKYGAGGETFWLFRWTYEEPDHVSVNAEDQDAPSAQGSRAARGKPHR